MSPDKVKTRKTVEKLTKTLWYPAIFRFLFRNISTFESEICTIWRTELLSNHSFFLRLFKLAPYDDAPWRNGESRPGILQSLKLQSFVIFCCVQFSLVSNKLTPLCSSEGESY